MVTYGDPKGTSAVKVWAVSPEATTLVNTLHFNEPVVRMALLTGRLVLGHRFGTVSTSDIYVTLDCLLCDICEDGVRGYIIRYVYCVVFLFRPTYWPTLIYSGVDDGLGRVQVRMLDLQTGRPVPVSQSGDHSAAVADIHVSEGLKHFLTCSSDGTLKVFDDQKRLEQVPSRTSYNITSFYRSSCANNGKDALNTPETLALPNLIIVTR
eukprot:1186019-Prorocentrum_minimum.AAC.4